MQKFNLGDTVEVITTEKKQKGIFLPSENDNVIVLKLTSGYNVGISKNKIKSIKRVRAVAKQEKKKLSKQKKNSKLPTISIIHTGGTIASQVSYETGAVTSRFTPEEIVAMFPEIQEVANVESKLLRNMWSGDMNVNHYNLIAKAIEKEVKKGVDGIIVTQGTDTLAYTSAALSFMLENLPVPVLMVYAQRSSDRGSSDAALNLFCAVKFLAESDFSDVGVCGHGTTNSKDCHIIQGCKARKLHSSQRNAFLPVNAQPLAVVSRKKITYKSKHYRKKKDGGTFTVKPFNPKINVGFYKLHPNMKAKELAFYNKYHGLIIEGTGLGNGPVDEIDEFTKENTKIYNTLKSLAKTMPVVMTTQCIFGRINMNVYSYGRKIKALGVLGDHTDIHPETAYIKLLWLLSNYPKAKVRELYGENVRGELTERSQEREFPHDL